MARGGFRPGAGRPRKKALPGIAKKLAPPAPPPTQADAKLAAAPAAEAAPENVEKTPLDYMLKVMNDLSADEARRDRMAIAAAPFVHARIGEDSAGKREKDAEAARRGASGKFETPPAPRLVVDNR